MRRQSQPPLGPLQQGLPSSAAQSYLQPQPLAHDPYSGAALQAAAAHLPPASWGQQPARSSFDGKAAAQRLSQPAAPLLPGLPFVEHAAAEGQAAVLQPPVQAPPPQRMRAAPPHAPPAQQQVQYQLQQEYQQHQQRPNIFAPAPGSDLDLVAAVAEEVAEYDLLRQEELEVQEKAAAVAAATQRVSALAERSSGGPLPTVRAGSSASSRLPSPKPMSLAASEQRPMSAARALQQWGHLLTPFEQSEILSFAAVWFVGKPGAPKIRGARGAGGGWRGRRGAACRLIHVALFTTSPPAVTNPLQVTSAVQRLTTVTTTPVETTSQWCADRVLEGCQRGAGISRHGAVHHRSRRSSVPRPRHTPTAIPCYSPSLPILLSPPAGGRPHRVPL